MPTSDPMSMPKSLFFLATLGLPLTACDFKIDAADEEPSWVLIGQWSDGRTVSHYIDANSIREVDGSKQAWTKAIAADDSTSSPIEQGWLLSQYDCDNHRTKRLQESSTGQDGTTVRHDVSGVWEYPIPGSIQETAFDFVCFDKVPNLELPEQQDADSGAWRDKVLPVEGTGRNLLQDAVFVTVRLPLGVSVDLPKDWTTLQENERKSIEDVVEQRAASLSLEDETDLLFAANLFDERAKTIALFNVRYYPDMDVSQAEVIRASSREIDEIDRALRSSIAIAGEQQGFEILSWNGTKRQSLNGIQALISDYRRAFSGLQPFRVRLVRVLDGPRSFTATVSYREDLADSLEWRTDRIVSSISQNR